MWSCDPTLVSTVTQSYQTTGPVLFGALQAFLAAQCLIVSDVYEDSDLVDILKDSYDFIVVGGGTAGSVVASRLSEKQHWKVLLLEAGGSTTLGTEVPALFINNYGTNEDWNFRTEPQKNACLNYKDQKCYWPRGKVLGGTSSINGMYYIRGNKKDYEDWGAISEDWEYQNVLPYFLTGNVTNAKRPDAKHKYNHNETDKSLNIEHDNELHPIEKILLDANQEIGSHILDNFDGERQIGVSTASTATKNGQRQSTSNVYLNPVKVKERLRIVKNAYVEKILFDDFVANKVRFHLTNNESQKYEVKAEKEIILSAGTINSAHILMKSGIGPEEKVTDKANINPKVFLPVGSNLQDHIYAPVMFKMESSDNCNSLPNIFKSFYEYVTDRKGPLSSLKPQRVISFINTRDSKSELPDIQNHFIVVYPNQSNFVDIFVQHHFSEQFYKSFNELNKNHIILIVYVTLLQPKSRGTVDLGEEYQPLINANYLNEAEDLETIIKGMKHVIKLKGTKAFKKAGLKLHWIEIDACSNISKKSDDFLKCITGQLTGTLYHAVGTNKMGRMDDVTAVVDAKLRVKSVDNLRVADASVIPNIIRGNTMAPVIMIAEKAAEFIKQDWL